MKIGIKPDIERVRAKLLVLNRDIVDKAVVSALNKTAAQAKTAASKQIRGAGYNLSAAEVKGAIEIKRASSGRLVAIVNAKGRPIPLIKFGAVEVKGRGVRVRVLNGTKMLPHAFIATMPSGHRGVFERVGKTHKKVRNGKWSGLPIKERFGPGIPKAFGSRVVQDALHRFIVEKFPRILESEMKYYISRSR